MVGFLKYNNIKNPNDIFNLTIQYLGLENPYNIMVSTFIQRKHQFNPPYIVN